MYGEAIRPQVKPRPKLLDKRDAQSDVSATDRQQRTICRDRSGGQCEVREAEYVLRGRPVFIRCLRKASENHHLLGGIGRRNKGRSLLAEHRLDVCARCHTEITGKVLVPTSKTTAELAATIRYERVR